MDVYCSTCNEPYDTDYLLHELIEELNWPKILTDEWRKSGAEMNPVLALVFEDEGWEFGRNILVIKHCPACPDKQETNEDRVAAKDAIAALLGADLDGLASAFEDMQHILGW